MAKRLSSEDLRIAFAYHREHDTDVARILSNPSFREDIEAIGVDVPVEYVETEIGLTFLPRAKSVPLFRIRNFFCDEDRSAFVETVGSETEAIRVWAWTDAPCFLSKFSEHGGDETWVALLPPKYSDVWVPWLESPAFATSSHKYMLPGGWWLVVAARS